MAHIGETDLIRIEREQRKASLKRLAWAALIVGLILLGVMLMQGFGAGDYFID